MTASTIGGNTIQVGANHDVNVTGSNVLGTGDVAISAGNKVRTNSAEDSSRNDIYQHSKKKGLMGAGLGFTIGSKQIKDTEAESYTTNVNTLIGSVDGTIAINADNDAHITSTDIIGKHGITVSAADITLDGNHDVAMSKQVHEEKQSGLTVSLGGSIASALNTAHGLQRKASSRNDKRLATLENIEAGKELKKGYEQIKEYQEFTPKFVKQRAEKLIDSSKIKKGYVAQIDEELKNPNLSDKEIRRLEKDRNRLQQEANQEYADGTSDLQDINSKDQKQYNAKKRAKKDGLANIHVSIGSSKSRSETTFNRRNYAGGKLVSDEGITLVAKPNMQDKGNIVAVGETIRGKSVALEASKDISLLAATNTSEKRVAYDSKGWSIGANLSVNGGGLLGLDANYNQGMERGNTFKTTHTGTVIQADQVNLHSGKDTTIAGSKVYGDSVTAEIGGNLTIKSLQDTETYRGKSKNAGFSVSTNGLQLGSVSAEYTKGTMKSDYASVTDQAGIYAGTGGFAIQTKGNTTLEGAVIGSKATADKNSLVTDSLTIKDIKNKAEYTSSNTGLSYTSVSGFKNLSQAGKDAVYNSLGLLPKLLPDSSKYSESTTKSAIANGTIKTQSSNIDIDKISRDTESSLNKLDTIFDKKKVEERQELARLFAKDAFEQLHYWKPRTKEEKVAKALAHAVVAESSARIAGNPVGSGFYAGLSNEALIGEIQKISKTNPAVAQWLSAALGAVVNGALDKPIVTGATEAQYGTKWNLNLTEHAKKVRLNEYNSFKKTFNDEYLQQLRAGNPYTQEQVYKAYNDLLYAYNNAEAFGITPAARDLLGFFLDENPNAHGIIAVDKTKDGYSIFTFGPDSLLNKTYRSSYYYFMNLDIVSDAVNKVGNKDVSMPTYTNSHNFYAYGVDPALSLGRASTITTFDKNKPYDRPIITIIDNWNHDKMLAELVQYPRIYEAAYILQQSGFRRTFAFKTTYEVSID